MKAIVKKSTQKKAVRELKKLRTNTGEQTRNRHYCCRCCRCCRCW